MTFPFPRRNKDQKNTREFLPVPATGGNSFRYFGFEIPARPICVRSRVVNKKSPMKQRTQTLAAFTATLGLLALVLAVSALAEKAHGDHLPERNGRGGNGAFIPFGIPAGILALLSAVSGPAAYRHRHTANPGTFVPPSLSRCTLTGNRTAMVWPMRIPGCPVCSAY